MPSPLGHALAGLSVGWLIAGPAGDVPAPSAADSTSGPMHESPGSHGGWWHRLTRSQGNRKRAAAFVLAGVVADLDLVAGAHSGWTHSVGAALIALAVAVLWPARSGVRRRSWGHLVMAVAVGAAYLTHPLLDFLGQDNNPPIGVMLLWPLSSRYFHSGFDWFYAISRRYWLPDFWIFNLRSVAREILLLAPPAAAVLAFRRPGGRVRTTSTAPLRFRQAERRRPEP